MPPSVRTVTVADETGTMRLADDIAAITRPGDVVALHGDLGMGKSAFARAVVRRLAGDPDLEVPSPTFTLLQSYETARFPVHHFDLYRLADPDELIEIGFSEAIGEGLSLIEWPDRAGDELPAERLDIVISEGDSIDGRRFALHGHGASWTERLEETFAVRDLLDRASFEGAERRHLHGDASTRSFERATVGNDAAVVMRWPAWRAYMKRADDDRYEEIVHLADNLTAFSAIADTLRRHGFRSPRILDCDSERRLMLVEDLGSDGIVRDGVPIAERYLVAARRLADLAVVAWPEIAIDDTGGRWPMPRYDRRALATEVGLFAAWYMPRLTGAPLAADARAEWDSLWDDLLARFDDDQQRLVLRDYHSPNILWQASGDPIGMIDFQDGLLGSPAYDFAALVTDARVDIPDELAAAMTAAYVERRQVLDAGFDAADFAERAAILGAQRNAKILGRFVEFAARTGRTHHLRFLPRVCRNFEKALDDKVLAGVKLWYERLAPPANRP
ncbi:tRNA (adenosine(37)-N6)-threonylcarbamoyltransferase complex ATPase subunit type 1 TsaE [Pleomorphomonas oryzae]|uniref:tRNA (adenosine(37)-N6)-threonylcarbamoyltransferase complex ATPase subunit type 1 TsaE n=1 Tax=Pleomorphomonas oryzae TaxID=261934 RepID=UPI000478B173|nr:tRNA (adenosine(37)-N6)-threonylcarbamoyltransferase complex ATPase subunit type 1 TsaE [Pleomorphomonas oryzae]